MSANINAGDLRYKIIIERKTVSRDAAGGEVATWSTLLTASASVEPVGGAELAAMAAGASSGILGLYATLPVKFVIRYRSGVLQTDRILYNSEHYDIININNMSGRKIRLEIMAVKGLRERL